MISTGTSTKGPITPANAYSDANPNVEMATAIANSKLFPEAVKDIAAFLSYSTPINLFKKKLMKNITIKYKVNGNATFATHVSFFIENSGSMFCYLNASNSTFKDQVYELISFEKSNPNKPYHQGFSLLLTLQTTNPINENLSIQLTSQIPQWVNDYSSTDDARILSEPQEQLKTFGLKYLIDGIYESTYKNNNSISTISIQISKQ